MKPLIGYDWPAGQSKQVAYISQDHHIHELSVRKGGIWQHTDLTQRSSAPLADNRFLLGSAWPEVGTKQVAYLAQNGHVHELWTANGETWQNVDVSALTGAPPAVRVTASYSWAEGHSKIVVYVDDDHHIHELSAEAGKPWRHVDLTAITNAPLPGSYFMVGYAFSEGRSKQVAYVGQEGHIHELYVEVGGQWQHIDLTERTNAPHAVDLMVGYEWPEARCKQVAFVSKDRHIHELCMVIGQSWQYADLSTITNAPPATNVLTGYAWPEGHSKQIAYVGQDGYIHELYVEAGQQWQWVNLTERAQAPVTPITSVSGYAWTAGETKQVTYTGDDGEIRELWMPRAGTWTATNLSQIVMAAPARFS
jgi:hypothetical protein